MQREALLGNHIKRTLPQADIEHRLPLGTVARPGIHQDAAREPAGDPERAVGRAAVDDDDLIAPRHTLEAVCKEPLLVLADDGAAHGRHMRGRGVESAPPLLARGAAGHRPCPPSTGDVIRLAEICHEEPEAVRGTCPPPQGARELYEVLHSATAAGA